MSKYVFVSSDGSDILSTQFDTLEEARARLKKFVADALPDSYKGDPLDYESEEGYSWATEDSCYLCSLDTKLHDDHTAKVIAVDF